MSVDPSDFADGAVRVRESKLAGHLGGLIGAFPVAAKHRDALRILGSDFVYAAPSPLPNDRGCWMALVRFGSVIEARFGFNREVVAYYTPHNDLQLRTYQRLEELLERAPRPATPDVFLLWSPDPMTRRKVQDWSNRAPFVVVGLPSDFSHEPVRDLWDSLSERLTTTNLYDQTLPVTGRDFFGRGTVLKELTKNLQSGRVSGIFGLRKTGKTSLVKELGRRVALLGEREQIFVLRDLETLPSAELDQVPNLLEDLRVNLLAELRKNNLRTYELVELPVRPSVPEFRRSVHALLGHIAKKDVNVVIALDEVESLIGPAGGWDAERPDVVELLGALRALVQENPNFNVVVSGLTSSVLEAGRLFGRENPFFAWASPLFLPRLTTSESREIVTRLGERMAVTWTDEAAESASVIADGHVFLLRTLAARVVETLSTDIGGRQVSTTTIQNARRQWRRSVSGHIREMLESVSRYYPDEHSLLDILISDPDQIGSVEEEFPSQIEHLLQLGLLADDADGGLRLTALAAFHRRGSEGLR